MIAEYKQRSTYPRTDEVLIAIDKRDDENKNSKPTEDGATDVALRFGAP